MKKIIISCPYNGLKKLEESLLKFCNKNDLIISDKNIKAIDDDNIYISRDNIKHPINTFNSAFIRYPYDLISPHVKDYKTREYTEFLKSLALMFSDISINDIKNAHFARNRFFSLKKARECGLNTPKSFLFRNNNIINISSFNYISKSLGNCYFSESLDRSEHHFKEILSFEKDGKDKAYIYPPHVISSSKKIKENIDKFNSCFVQDNIMGDEYRIFLVGKETFIYKRKTLKSIDKSSAGLVKVSNYFFRKDLDKLKKLQKKLKLQYLCLDVIYKNKLFIIDINPFGSFPAQKRDLGVTDALAKLLLK